MGNIERYEDRQDFIEDYLMEMVGDDVEEDEARDWAEDTADKFEYHHGEDMYPLKIGEDEEPIQGAPQ